VKIVTSFPRRYVKLVEAFRDSQGVPRQRVVATLGRLETLQAGEANPLIDGLLRASGQPTLAEGTGRVEFAPARSVGDTWLLTALWQELGFGKAFRCLLRNAHPSFDAECLLRVMVVQPALRPEVEIGHFALAGRGAGSGCSHRNGDSPAPVAHHGYVGGTRCGIGYRIRRVAASSARLGVVDRLLRSDDVTDGGRLKGRR
jgi:hypothetical protein